MYPFHSAHLIEVEVATVEAHVKSLDADADVISGQHLSTRTESETPHHVVVAIAGGA